MNEISESQRTFIRRGWKAWSVVVVVGLAGIVYSAVQTVFLRQPDPVSRASFDWIQRFRVQQAFSNVCLVEIDSAALARHGDPINRTNFSQLIDRSAQAGVRLLFFDLLFDEARPGVQDVDLGASLSRASNVVIGGALFRRPTEHGMVTDHPKGRVVGEVTEAMVPLTNFMAGPVRNWGLLDLIPDPDQVVRRLYGRFSLFRGRGHPDFISAAWVAARRMKADLGSDSGEYWLGYYGPARSVYRHVGLGDAIEHPETLAGSEMVFVGVNQERMTGAAQRRLLRDEHPSPYGGAYHTGLELQATAVLNLVRGDVLVRKSILFQALICVAWATGAVGLFTFRRKLWMQVAVPVLAVGMGGVFAVLAARGGYWWPWLIPVGVQTVAACLVSPFIPAPALGRPRVFISYSGPNKRDPHHRHGAGHARAIREALRHRGIPSYFAPEQMRIGDRFSEELPAAIERTPCFLLILTPGALAELGVPDSWVRREVDCALESRRRCGRPRLMVVRTVGHGEQVKPLKPPDLPRELVELSEGHDVELDLERSFDAVMREIERGLA